MKWIVAYLVTITAAIAATLLYIDPAWCPFVEPPLAPVVKASVKVMVANDEDIATGSGTVVKTARGTVVVLTARHVVKALGHGAEVCIVKEGGADSHKWKVSMVHVSGFDDLAYLGFSDPVSAPEPAPLAFTWKPKLGEKLWTVGSPLGIQTSLSPAWFNGLVHDPRYSGRSKSLVRYSGDGFYGSSGGGLFCNKGHKWALCGVTVRKVSGDPRTPLEAVPLSVVRNFLGYKYGQED